MVFAGNLGCALRWVRLLLLNFARLVILLCLFIMGSVHLGKIFGTVNKNIGLLRLQCNFLQVSATL
jgi:hypothetical protein